MVVIGASLPLFPPEDDGSARKESVPPSPLVWWVHLEDMAEDAVVAAASVADAAAAASVVAVAASDAVAVVTAIAVAVALRCFSSAAAH